MSDSNTTSSLDELSGQVPNEFREMSFTELMALLDDGTVSHIQDVDEIRKVEKETLIGKAFILTTWRHISDGDYGEFVVCEVTTLDNEKLIFIDGSTGIKEQLKAYELKLNGVKPIYVPKGLRVSNYSYVDPFDGKAKPASTYYFNNESA